MDMLDLLGSVDARKLVLVLLVVLAVIIVLIGLFVGLVTIAAAGNLRRQYEDDVRLSGAYSPDAPAPSTAPHDFTGTSGALDETGKPAVRPLSRPRPATPMRRT